MTDHVAALPAEVLFQVAQRLERADVAAAQLVSRDWAVAWAATVLSLAPGVMSAPPAPGFLRLAERFPQLQVRCCVFPPACASALHGLQRVFAFPYSPDQGPINIGSACAARGLGRTVGRIGVAGRHGRVQRRCLCIATMIRLDASLCCISTGSLVSFIRALLADSQQSLEGPLRG